MADVDGFDDFYRGSRHRLLGYVYLISGDLGEAQDAVQEAYVRAWQRWPTVSGYADPESWVRVVAARIVVSRWRSLRSRARAYLRHGPPPDTPEISTDTLAIVEALRQLPEPQRVAIVLHHLLELPVTDVAQETGAPVGTVKARLTRGRAALADLLAIDLEETADA
ncbi:MAG TPA: SigE family RNA polymerase sigma factor [Micromonospora sp.]